ncbi:hypothetical protein HERIO_2172 [Hepatospora eriocheir]|uniref:Uncharacterized protein n=1 Tax=Hepatospora eriocheir TaxID=1081669 RepID=A0A1X0Q7W1_9MICR|nr:hypothetical protein HERIO_2172 [Hepatospora eriocheir]
MNFYECSLLKLIRVIIDNFSLDSIEYNLNNINCFIYSLNNLMRFTVFYNQLKQFLNSFNNNEKNIKIKYKNLVGLFKIEIVDLKNSIDTFKENYFNKKETITYYSSKYKDNYKITIKNNFCSIEEAKNNLEELKTTYLLIINKLWRFIKIKENKRIYYLLRKHKWFLIKEYEKYIKKLN